MKEYIFYKYRYAIAFAALTKIDSRYKLYVDLDYTISLIDRKFVLNNNIFIKKISTVMNIKGINNKKYNVSEYIRLKLFFYKLADIALIEREFHIVDDLTITVLIDIDIIKLKRITLDFGNNAAIFEYYNNISISIEVHSYSK